MRPRESRAAGWSVAVLVVLLALAAGLFWPPWPNRAAAQPATADAAAAEQSAAAPARTSEIVELTPEEEPAPEEPAPEEPPPEEPAPDEPPAAEELAEEMEPAGGPDLSSAVDEDGAGRR